MNKIVIIICVLFAFVLTCPVTAISQTDSEKCRQFVNKEDYVSAFKLCSKAAALGDHRAQGVLGLLYFDGTGVQQNIEEGVRWWLKSAKQGNTQSMNMLGDAYLNGVGIKKDEEGAVKWFQKAAKKGNADAQFKLSKMYAEGKILKRDNKLAVYWEEKAADNGSLEAQGYLCFKFLYEKNYVKAVKWCQAAADKDDMSSMENIGYIYRIGGHGITQNYELSEKWLRNAVSLGNNGAKAQLGYLYYGKKQYIASARWLLEAAEAGDDGAANQLGLLYSDGLGVTRDYTEAAKWFHRSALLGYSAAQVNLGLAYSDGKGVAKDNVLAYVWLNIAAADKPEVIDFKNSIEKQISDEELLKAQQLSTKLKNDIEQNKLARILGKNSIKPKTEDVVQTKEKGFPSIGHLTVVKPSFSANDFALIIGIEKYRSAPPTQFAVSDAKLVREYFRAMGMPERNIEFLTDERATYSDIRKVLETKLPNTVKPDSRVMVYYAGHGAPNPTDGTAHIIPYDGDPSYLRDTAYPLERMYEKLSELPAKEVLVVMDACFSGAGGRSVLPPGTRSLVARPKIQPQNRIIVLASTQDNQITTTLPEQRHGLFTYFFLRALQEKKKDIVDIYHYLKPQVEDEAKRQNVDQSPTITPSADKLKGRFVFFN